MPVSLFTSHRQGRHEKAAAPPAAPPVPEPPPELPARFQPLLDWAEARALGLWTDPQAEASLVALRREYDAWQQEQQGG